MIWFASLIFTFILIILLSFITKIETKLTLFFVQSNSISLYNSPTHPSKIIDILLEGEYLVAISNSNSASDWIQTLHPQVGYVRYLKNTIIEVDIFSFCSNPSDSKYALNTGPKGDPSKVLTLNEHLLGLCSSPENSWMNQWPIGNGEMGLLVGGNWMSEVNPIGISDLYAIDRKSLLQSEAILDDFDPAQKSTPRTAKENPTKEHFKSGRSAFLEGDFPKANSEISKLTIGTQGRFEGLGDLSFRYLIPKEGSSSPRNIPALLDLPRPPLSSLLSPPSPPGSGPPVSNGRYPILSRLDSLTSTLLSSPTLSSLLPPSPPAFPYAYEDQKYRPASSSSFLSPYLRLLDLELGITSSLFYTEKPAPSPSSKLISLHHTQWFALHSLPPSESILGETDKPERKEEWEAERDRERRDMEETSRFFSGLFEDDLFPASLSARSLSQSSTPRDRRKGKRADRQRSREAEGEADAGGLNSEEREIGRRRSKGGVIVGKLTCNQYTVSSSSTLSPPTSTGCLHVSAQLSRGVKIENDPPQTVKIASFSPPPVTPIRSNPSQPPHEKSQSPASLSLPQNVRFAGISLSPSHASLVPHSFLCLAAVCSSNPQDSSTPAPNSNPWSSNFGSGIIGIDSDPPSNQKSNTNSNNQKMADSSVGFLCSHASSMTLYLASEKEDNLQATERAKHFQKHNKQYPPAHPRAPQPAFTTSFGREEVLTESHFIDPSFLSHLFSGTGSKIPPQSDGQDGKAFTNAGLVRELSTRCFDRLQWAMMTGQASSLVVNASHSSSLESDIPSHRVQGGFRGLLHRQIESHRPRMKETEIHLDFQPQFESQPASASTQLISPSTFTSLPRSYLLTSSPSLLTQLGAFYQFSKYLLYSAASSGGSEGRGEGRGWGISNLQGVWADGRQSVWSGDYHLNINLQMQYWPSDTLSLGYDREEGEGRGTQRSPRQKEGVGGVMSGLVRFLRRMRRQGERAAIATYGLSPDPPLHPVNSTQRALTSQSSLPSRGWVGHGYTDGFLSLSPMGVPILNYCPTCGAWAAMSLFDHSLFYGVLLPPPSTLSFSSSPSHLRAHSTHLRANHRMLTFLAHELLPSYQGVCIFLLHYLHRDLALHTSSPSPSSSPPSTDRLLSHLKNISSVLSSSASPSSSSLLDSLDSASLLRSLQLEQLKLLIETLSSFLSPSPSPSSTFLSANIHPENTIPAPSRSLQSTSSLPLPLLSLHTGPSTSPETSIGFRRAVNKNNKGQTGQKAVYIQSLSMNPTIDHSVIRHTANAYHLSTSLLIALTEREKKRHQLEMKVDGKDKEKVSLPSWVLSDSDLSLHLSSSQQLLAISLLLPNQALPSSSHPSSLATQSLPSSLSPPPLPPVSSQDRILEFPFPHPSNLIHSPLTASHPLPSFPLYLSSLEASFPQSFSQLRSLVSSPSPSSSAFLSFEDFDGGHRHFSSMHSLYPSLFLPHSSSLSPLTAPHSSSSSLGRWEDLQHSQRNSLQFKKDRGGAHTSWSASWSSCLWSRVGEGERVWEDLRNILTKYSTPHFFSLHPPLLKHEFVEGTNCMTCFSERGSDPGERKRPSIARGLVTKDQAIFQLDGNLGFVSGMSESFLQSHSPNLLSLLPALPPLSLLTQGLSPLPLIPSPTNSSSPSLSPFPSSSDLSSHRRFHRIKSLQARGGIDVSFLFSSFLLSTPNNNAPLPSFLFDSIRLLFPSYHPFHAVHPTSSTSPSTPSTPSSSSGRQGSLIEYTPGYFTWSAPSLRSLSTPLPPSSPMTQSYWRESDLRMGVWLDLPLSPSPSPSTLSFLLPETLSLGYRFRATDPTSSSPCGFVSLSSSPSESELTSHFSSSPTSFSSILSGVDFPLQHQRKGRWGFYVEVFSFPCEVQIILHT